MMITSVKPHLFMPYCDLDLFPRSHVQFVSCIFMVQICLIQLKCCIGAKCTHNQNHMYSTLNDFCKWLRKIINIFLDS